MGLDAAARGLRLRLDPARAEGLLAVATLLLDAGFPVDAQSSADGGTPLHHAAYAGSLHAVRLLLERGANKEALDTTWRGTPLGWAMVGSGERPRHNSGADWLATVQTLLDAGVSTEKVTLSLDDLKPPSPEVAALPRAHGIGANHRPRAK